MILKQLYATINHQRRSVGILFSSLGLAESSESPELSESEVLVSLVKVQLPAVGVSSPSEGLWNSPKSPKLSNDESSISSENEENVNGSEPLATAESENGPKPSLLRHSEYSC